LAFKYCKSRKEFFFPGLSILVTFFTFHMEDSKPATSPFQSGVKLVATCPSVDATLYHHLVGSLLYLTHIHLDISFVVGLVSWYMQTPHESHWKATKTILQYVWGTVQFGIHYSSRGTPLLVGLTDLDWVGNPNDRKSTASYVYSLGSGPVTWAFVRNNRLLLFLQQKQSTKQRLMQVKKPCGFNRSFQSLDSNHNIQPPSGATIRVPSSSPKIQFNISTSNTSSYTCIHQKAHS
jgi:hypothetical protein